jgi:hypothetical protein
MKSTENASATSPSSEELTLLYEVSVQDIALFKQQQWTVTNYALLIDGGLLFIASELLPEPLSMAYKVAISALVGGALASAIWVCRKLQNAIEGRRERLRRLRAHFSKAFEQVWTIEKDHDEIPLLLQWVIAIAGAVVVWVIVVEM